MSKSSTATEGKQMNTATETIQVNGFHFPIQPQTEDKDMSRKVLFISNHDEDWHTPASIGVIEDGKELGVCVKHVDMWKFYRKEKAIIDGKPFSYERRPSVKAPTLSKLKEEVMAFYSA